MNRIMSFLAVLGAAAMITGCGGGGASSSQSKPAITYVSVKAEDMMDDYIRDYGSAQKKYKDQNVNVTGKFIRKGQFDNSDHFYAIIGSKYAAGKSYTVIVDYSTEDVDAVNKYKPGDLVAVKGSCVGTVDQKDPTEVSIQITAGKTVSGESTKEKGNNKESSSTVKEAPAKESAPAPAPAPTPEPAPQVSFTSSSPEGLFRYFHQSITNHELRNAFNCFSDSFKNGLDYDGWAKGYDTTLKSIPEKVSELSNDGSRAVLSYRLKAVDRSGDSNVTQYFTGQCTLYKVDGLWKIDEITAQKA